ncbi:hypothetical protein PanWU01x14_179810 [Parasponia andersonii]|uniref:Retrotransposon gag domain-containing protein n=1 Tax=Parasponia andersonii TaxID=3476 RepID=A0A2P5C6B5_PARAD|nr:hypothetical protein PanWU01x14_179810 [Parasponia andersonii]
MRLQLRQYDGTLDPLVANTWLCEMTRYFQTLGIPREFWAVFAISCLTRNAIHWVETIEVMQNVESVTYEEFERLFKAHYANDDQQAEVVGFLKDLLKGVEQ